MDTTKQQQLGVTYLSLFRSLPGVADPSAFKTQCSSKIAIHVSENLEVQSTKNMHKQILFCLIEVSSPGHIQQ